MPRLIPLTRYRPEPTKSYKPEYLPNKWYKSPYSLGYAGGVSPFGNILAYPLLVFETLRIDKIAIYVEAGAAGGKVRIGIYDNDGSGYPRNLLAQSELDASQAGVKEASADLLLAKNQLYWGAVMANDVTISVADSDGQFHYFQDGSVDIVCSYLTALAYQSLPSTFPSGATKNSHMGFFLIHTKQ